MVQDRLLRLYSQGMMIQPLTIRKENTVNKQNQKASDICMWGCRSSLQISKRTLQL